PQGVPGGGGAPGGVRLAGGPGPPADASTIHGPHLEDEGDRRLAQAVIGVGLDEERTGEAEGGGRRGQRDDQDHGQRARVGRVLDDDGGPAPALLVAGARRELDPGDVADGHEDSSRSHWSIWAQASSPARSQASNSARRSGSSSAAGMTISTRAPSGSGAGLWGTTRPFLMIPGMTTRSVSMRPPRSG